MISSRLRSSSATPLSCVSVSALTHHSVVAPDGRIPGMKRLPVWVLAQLELPELGLPRHVVLELFRRTFVNVELDAEAIRERLAGADLAAVAAAASAGARCSASSVGRSRSYGRLNASRPSSSSRSLDGPPGYSRRRRGCWRSRSSPTAGELVLTSRRRSTSATVTTRRWRGSCPRSWSRCVKEADELSREAAEHFASSASSTCPGRVSRSRRRPSGAGDTGRNWPRLDTAGPSGVTRRRPSVRPRTWSPVVTVARSGDRRVHAGSSDDRGAEIRTRDL